MSNQAVGEVYQRIIQEVCQVSLIDFEEAGVSAATLEELRLGWQQKLTDLHIAHFPWDPTPPPAQPEPPAKKNAPQQAMPPQVKKEGGINVQPQLIPQDGVRIKTEPGYEQQGIPAHSIGNPSLNPQLAAMRAQQNIQQKFGGAAVPLMMQQQQHQQHQQQQQQQRNGAPQKPPGGGLMLPGLGPMQPQVHNGQSGIPQHDGASDVHGELIPVEGWGNLTRAQADKIILTKIENVEKYNQAFGAAVQSLGNKQAAVRRRRPDAYEATLSADTSYPYPPSMHSPAVARPSQLDGGSSAEPEEDEDAINSDLDDPEDGDIENQDEDETPQQVMLCMYDKVQRTKNKWKCVLKDGVLTIEGKEYVFHKANGEYEW
ncbi:transcription factor IIA, alpha/beta subunit [Tirmania nivea]|nr:transcription factor IIA, alpha/beta subunit [Tirmania nivea]